jgi:hypothetical protein
VVDASRFGRDQGYPFWGRVDLRIRSNDRQAADSEDERLFNPGSHLSPDSIFSSRQTIGNASTDLRRGDADGVGAAGADGAARGRLAGFIQADFDGGEIVVAAAEGHRGGRDFGVGLGDEVEDLCGWKRDLAGELSEGRRDGDRLEGGASGAEEGVGCEARAGAVGAPFVLEEAGIGVDVGVLRGIGRARSGGAVLRVGAVRVLGPETVEDEGGVARALSGVGMGVAELG